MTSWPCGTSRVTCCYDLPGPEILIELQVYAESLDQLAELPAPKDPIQEEPFVPESSDNKEPMVPEL